VVLALTESSYHKGEPGKITDVAAFVCNLATCYDIERQPIAADEKKR
jgi:hypothetical protein